MRAAGAILFSLIAVTWGFSQPATYTASWYHAQNTGLSHNTVTGITMDQNGFLWVGTIDGLNRFDGRSVKIFRHKAFDSTSISNSFIHGILPDDKGNLWIGTRDGGTNKFDPVTETFIHFKYSEGQENGFPNVPMNLFYQDSEGIFWAAFWDEWYGIFDPEKGTYRSAKLISRQTGELLKSPNTVITFNDGSLIAASFSGLYYIPETEITAFKKDVTKHRLQAEEIPLTLPGGLPNLNRLIIDKYGSIWFSGEGSELMRLPEPLITESMKASISSGIEVELSQKNFVEKDDYLVYGVTNAGICTQNIISEESACEKITVDGENFEPTKFYHDPTGGIWAASWGKGFIRLKERTTFAQFNSNNQPEMETDFMLAFEEEPEEGLWFGGANGLYYLDQASNNVSTPNDRIFEVFGDRSIWSLERDKQGLWVITRQQGLFFVPLDTEGMLSGTIQNYTPENSFVKSYYLHQVFIDSRGWMWLGYEGDGLQLIRNPESIGGNDPLNVQEFGVSETSENRIGGDKIRKIYEDQNGDIWLATMQNGFTKIEINNGSIGSISILKNNPDQPNSLSFNDGRSIYHQNDSTYWFATYGGGINRWNPSTGEFLRLGTEQGLANNSTYGILPDANELHIWISTNSGLARLDTESLEFKTYTPEEGIQNLEFNTGAYHQLSDGKLVFGGIGGFNIIDTKKLKIDDTPPPVYLTDIKLFNESYKADTSAIYKKNLELKHDQNFLSFEFAALDFDNPTANQFAYKMEGIDAGWVYSGNRNFADYPNLEPGEYAFRVKASNGDGTWNEAGVSLPVNITPPWWATLWFRITAGSILFAGFILGIRHLLQRRLKEQIHQMEVENKLRSERERISRDLHDHVGAQLANIKTGLSLAEKYSKADNKEKSSGLMNSIMNDADLTIKQLRETIWALNQNCITPYKFMEHVKLYFRNQTALNEILNMEYFLDSDRDVELSATHALNIFRIVQEASQNTLKYANAQNLKISMILKKGLLTVMVQDDGCFKGSETDFNSGYGMGNMKKRAGEIEGELRVDTTNGTKVILELSLL